MYAFNHMSVSTNQSLIPLSNNGGAMPPRTISAIPLPHVMPVQLRSPPVAVSRPFTNIRAAKKVKYLVIFDWDDTLFPTTALRINEGQSVPASDLYNLGLSVYKLLDKYIARFGSENLCIVTNGRKSWVLDSLKMVSDLYQAYCEENDDESEQKEKGQNYFAAIYNTLISSHPITVISAQDEFANRYPQQPTIWKTKVFKSVVKAHFDLYSGSNDNIYTIISIGDSDDEYTASHEAKQMITTMNRLNRNNNIVRCHRIKLKVQPTINEMVSQIASLMKEVEVLQNEKGSMTIHYAQHSDDAKESVGENVHEKSPEQRGNIRCSKLTDSNSNGVNQVIADVYQPQPSK